MSREARLYRRAFLTNALLHIEAQPAKLHSLEPLEQAREPGTLKLNDVNYKSKGWSYVDTIPLVTLPEWFDNEVIGMEPVAELS